MFTRGEKVVCVDDDWSTCWSDPRRWFNHLPVKGRVYVVQEMKHATNGELMAVLVGVISHPYGGGFYPWRFRKLSELKSNAEIKEHFINLMNNEI